MQRAIISTPEGFEAMTVSRTNGSYCVHVNMMFIRAMVFVNSFLSLFRAEVPYAEDGLESTFVVQVPPELRDDFLDIVAELYFQCRV